MQNLPNDGNQDNQLVSITFTRKQFSDFVFTHVQTPSEETRKTYMGFELTKQRLKSIVDKLDYYVEKNNRLMNKEFSSTVSVDINRTLKRGSYKDFFDIDTFESCFFDQVSVTLSYLIDFGLEDGPAQPEKQVVVLRFDTKTPSNISTEIRTTEFTWPDAIFSIIKKELDDLKSELRDASPISQSPLFYPARLFSQTSNSTSFLQRKTFEVSLVVSTMTIAFLTVGIDILNPTVDEGQNKAYVFDLESKLFSEVNPNTYFQSSDWREKLSFVRDSEDLKFYLQNSAEQNEKNVVRITESLGQFFSLPAWFYALVIVFAVLTWLNFREAARIRINRVGRIWLSSRKQPERPGIAASEGVLFGLIMGVTGSAICAAIIAGISSLVN